MEKSEHHNLPATSLILCTRNRPKLVLECVRSVLLGDEVPTELIIVDDSNERNSDLQSLITERPCNIRYLWTRSIGLSRANNDGIAAAKHDILVFTQDDVLVAPRWFGIIVRALIDAGQHSVVTGQVLPGEPEMAGAFAPSTKSNTHGEVYRGRIGADVLYVQNMAIYRSAINRVGAFDQRLGPGTPFPGAEDNDFGHRLLEAECRILYEPRAVTYHRAWRPKGNHLSLHWGYARAQGGFYAKYLNLKDRYMLHRMGRDLKYHFVELTRPVWRGHMLPAMHLVYICGLVVGVGYWFITQRRTQPWSN
jgi:GT2 family glycosyltransferase